MSTTGLRKCWHCETWFKPQRRNAWHQRFCVASECQAASKRHSQRKWCRSNPSYFRGPNEVQRVQAWRRKHPGYSNRESQGTGPEPPSALQDVLLAQPVDEKLVAVLRDRLSTEISRPLQDVVVAQQHLLLGLTAMISGEALQEDIVRVLTVCYERGQRIGGMVPWMPQQEVKHERSRTDSAAAAAPHSPAVQLDRSSSGP